MSERPPNVDSLFLSAREIKSPDERAAFLARSCGDDVALRHEVERLLAAPEAMPTSFLDVPAVRDVAEDDLAGTIDHVPSARPPVRAAVEHEGERIGRYKLLQEIGEGGFGTVWMAEQMEPVSRRVALKIIKLGMDTKEVIARFEAERQALAMMDHPNIAKVLDAGATDKGRPFFVMELVKGIPITQFCDEARLGTRERLALFGDVCSAINHAHQKGVIHRDIKPSNVMVTLHGDKPVVKVIDFGIAKATQGKLTDKTLFTRFEQFIGTPVYMSPEQASLSGLDIDTRSDIYALGILLYELLVGKPPFDGKSLLSAGYDEMRRIIREVEPAKPSSRISTMVGEERMLLAKSRHIEPAKVGRLVEPDLDWIVMKAIEKDRTRRYETASAFAQDIAHFLADEAVSATPPSAGYQFRKFARRNKAALRVAAAIAAMLVAATTVSTWQAVRATRAEQKTAETLAQVATERDAKELARKDAEDISKFLGEVFQSPDPERDGRTITVAETLDTAAKKLETDLATQPAQRAKLQATLGETYESLGLARQAIPLREKARDYYLATSGPEHPDTLKAVQSLAISYSNVGRLPEALKMEEEVLTLSRKVLGPEHADSLMAMHCLACSYYETGRRDEALRLQEEVLTLGRKVNGPEHRYTLWAMGNLANSYDDTGRKDEALKLRGEVLALSRKVNGPEHRDTLTAMINLAASYHNTGRRDEALKMEEEVLPLYRKVLGPEHPNTLLAMNNLANSYHETGRRDEALKMREELLPLSRKALGSEHPTTLMAMSGLAASCYDASRKDEALKLREEVLALYRKMHSEEHPDTLLAMGNLAGSYYNANRRDEALKLGEEMLTLRRKRNGPEHPSTLSVMIVVADNYADVGRQDEALKLREEVLTLSRKVNGPEHRDTLEAMSAVAVSYREKGEVARAEALEKEITAAKAKQFWGDRAQDKRVARLYESGLKENVFQQQSDGTWAVNLADFKDFNDLAIFQGTRVSRLILKGTAVTDLTPLGGLALKLLNLEKTKVTDFSPLKGMPLEELTLNDTAIADLTVLRGLLLQKLGLDGTAIADFEPLRGMKLTSLDLGRCGQVSDLSPLKGMPLNRLGLWNCKQVSDLTPLIGMPLTNLDLNYCGQVQDLTPLRGMKLQHLALNRIRVRELTLLYGMPLTGLTLWGCGEIRDLTPLAGLKLTSLNIGQCGQVQDLTPLKGLPLGTLICDGTKVADLSPLQGMGLTQLVLTPKNITKGLDVIRQMKSLKTIGIGGAKRFPPEEFWKKYDAGEFGKPVTNVNDPAFQAWMKTVAALRAEKQAEAVSKKLMELNPGFNGKLTGPFGKGTSKIENGAVTDLQLLSDNLTDISPVRALVGLKFFDCSGTGGGNGKLSDLSPLQGMPLTGLLCVNTPVSNLLPLQECKSLKVLQVTNTKVTAAGVAALRKALPNCKIEWDDPAKPKTPVPAAAGSK